MSQNEIKLQILVDDFEASKENFIEFKDKLKLLVQKKVKLYFKTLNEFVLNKKLSENDKKKFNTYCQLYCLNEMEFAEIDIDSTCDTCKNLYVKVKAEVLSRGEGIKCCLVNIPWNILSLDENEMREFVKEEYNS